MKWIDPLHTDPPEVGDLRICRDGTGRFWVQMYDEIANSTPPIPGWRDVGGPYYSAEMAKERGSWLSHEALRIHVTTP